MSDITQQYISKELTHFVGRGKQINEQFELFLKIIKEGCITHPPHVSNYSGNLTVNYGAKISENEMYAPEITCFADIPFHDLSLHMDKYSRVGMSFSKDFIAKQGGVPVHYIAKGAVVKRLKVPSFEDIVKKLAENEYESFISDPFSISSKSEYFDEMLEEYSDLFKTF